jgi:hypothetical protein
MDTGPGGTTKMRDDGMGNGYFTAYQWDGLAKAIVMQATIDYETSLRRLRVLRYRDKAGRRESNRAHLDRIRENFLYNEQQRHKTDCEWFFRSRWYAALCDINGEQVMAQVRENAKGGDALGDA